MTRGDEIAERCIGYHDIVCVCVCVFIVRACVFVHSTYAVWNPGDFSPSSVRFHCCRRRRRHRCVVVVVEITAATVVTATVTVTQRNTPAWTIGVPRDRTRVVVVGTPSCGCARANATVETARSRRCDRRTRGTAADASRKHAVQLTLAAASAAASRNMASSNTDSPGKCSSARLRYRPQMPHLNRPFDGYVWLVPGPMLCIKPGSAVCNCFKTNKFCHHWQSMAVDYYIMRRHAV